MRALVAPTDNPGEVYQTCVNSITDENLRNRLNLLTNYIGVAAADYQQRAAAKQFYTIPQNNCGNDDIALGSVTKTELKNVYSTHMVGQKKPARAIYDLLKSKAPLGRCPFCGIGHVSTLDHYLPKAKYPQLSVVPLNLVPSCKDCNTEKSTAVASTAEAQSLHPYFDHQNFISEQWLFAEIICPAPVTIRFFVQAPEHWDEISKARVQAHFRGFKLDSRYSVEAGYQVSCLREMLSQYERLSPDEIRQMLAIKADGYAKLHRNSWETAMYQVLSASDWYCEGGFR